MSMEFASITSIASINKWIVEYPEAFPVLQKLYEAAGPQLPTNLKATRVKTTIPNLPAFYYNYDEGHAGRITVPYTRGASVAFEWVLKRPNLSHFILENLTFHLSDILINTTSFIDGTVQPINLADSSNTGSNENNSSFLNTSETNNSGNKKQEVAVFIPGLNTLHQPAKGETTTPQRLIQYVKTITLPMSQIHIGTQFDQGDFKIDSGDDEFDNEVINSPSIPSELRPSRAENGDLVWNARQLDSVQAALSKLNLIDTPVKKGIRGLLDNAYTSPDNKQPVTIIGYSRGSIEIATELNQFIDKKVKDERIPKSSVEKKLRERVTIVTVGSSTNNFPNGPAYIHLAAYTDPLASTSGVTSIHNSEEKYAGADAVFLNCSSPYNPLSFDNHNFGAVTSQFLALILEMNNISSGGFREIWNLAQAGKLIIPEDEDQLTRAVIQLTRGYKWLWNASEAWEGIPFGALPSDEGAKQLLRRRVGSKFVDRLVKTFG